MSGGIVTGGDDSGGEVTTSKTTQKGKVILKFLCRILHSYIVYYE